MLNMFKEKPRKGEGSLDALFFRVLEKIKEFWSPHVSGYLVELIKVKITFRGGVRNIKKKSNNGIIKGDGSLGPLLKRLVEKI